eukprot:6964317-Pyramimonas_sp.AAC.1
MRIIDDSGHMSERALNVSLKTRSRAASKAALVRAASGSEGSGGGTWKVFLGDYGTLESLPRRQIHEK